MAVPDRFYGVAVTGAFSTISAWIIRKIVAALVGLPVARDEQTEGLDAAPHGRRVLLSGRGAPQSRMR